MTTLEHLQSGITLSLTTLASVKQNLVSLQDSSGKMLAADDNILADSGDFERFEAHDKASYRVSASLQAACERLTEAEAHIAEALKTYQNFAEQTQKDKPDEN